MKNQIKKTISTILATSLIAMLILPVTSFAALSGITFPQQNDYTWKKDVMSGKEPVGFTCESNGGGYGLSKVTDGIGHATETSACVMAVAAKAPGQKGYLIYDLGTNYKIGGASIDYAYRTAVGYNTLYGSSGQNGPWTEIFKFDDVDGLANDTYTVESKFLDDFSSAPEYRYIKLEGQTAGGVYKIYEIEVYALINSTLEIESTTPGNNADYQENDITLDFNYDINLDSAKANIEVWKGETKLTLGDDADYTVALDATDATKVYVTLTEAPVYNIEYKIVVSKDLNAGLDGYKKFKQGSQNFELKFKNNQIPVPANYNINYLYENNIVGTASVTVTNGNVSNMTNGSWHETVVGVSDYAIINDTQNPPSAVFDLGEQISVGGAKLNYNYRDAIGKISVYGSNDNSGWTKLATFGANTDYTQHPAYGNPAGQISILTEDIRFEPVSYRYIKVQATNTGILKIFEVAIYAVENLKIKNSNLKNNEMFTEKTINLEFNKKINLNSAKESISLFKGTNELCEGTDYEVSLDTTQKTVNVTLAKKPNIGEKYKLVVSKNINNVDGFISFDETVTEDIIYNFYNKQIEHNEDYLIQNNIVGTSEHVLAGNGKIENITNGNWQTTDVNVSDYGIINNSGAAPEITFDLKKEIGVGGAKLNYNYRDEIGRIKVLGSLDGEVWEELGIFGANTDYSKHPDYGKDNSGRIPCITEEIEFSPATCRYVKFQGTKPGVFKIFEAAVYESAISDFVTPKLDSEGSDISDEVIDVPYETTPVYDFSFCCNILPEDINKNNISLVSVKNGKEISKNDIFTVAPNSTNDGFTMTFNKSLEEDTQYVIKIKNIKAVTENPELAKTMKDTFVSFTTAKNYELLTPTVSADATSVSVSGNMRTYHNVKNQPGVIIAALLKNGKFVEVKNVPFTATDIATGFDELLYSFGFTHTRTPGDTYTVKIYAVDDYTTIGKICEKQSVAVPGV